MKLHSITNGYYCNAHNRGRYTYLLVYSSNYFATRNPIIWLVVSTKFYETERWKPRLETYLRNKKPLRECEKPSDAIYE